MKITPLSDVLGAEITGIDVGSLDDSSFKQVREAFLKHHMLVFRDQDLSVASQATFSNRFGDMDVHIQKESAHPERPEVQILSNKKVNGKYVGSPSAGDNWHTDLQYTDIPTMCTLLYAVETPEEGGDTEWANMYLAYETLPENTKERLDGLKARHSFNRFRNKRVEVPEVYKGQGQKRYVDVAPPDAIHPVVRTHPETGRKALYVSPAFTVALEDMTVAESKPILEHLHAVGHSPEFCYRHRWLPGDLVLWDNRSVQHYAVHDHGDATRTLHRITIQGDTPR